MQNSSINSTRATSTTYDSKLRDYMLSVYREMGFALGISGFISFFIGNDLKNLMTGEATILPVSLLTSLYSAPLSYIIMFAPFAIVMFMSFKINSLSPSGARKALYAFASLMGLSMAGIFAIYTGSSIASAFLSTSIVLAGVSLWGYTTKKDITSWGSFLMMGVIALIIASVINIFLGSGSLGFVVNIITVGIFTGLMAYDTQRIKTNYLSLRGQVPDAQLESMGTMGALSMYINFINVFISLLNLFGQRN